MVVNVIKIDLKIFLIVFFITPIAMYLVGVKNQLIWLDDVTYETYFDYGVDLSYSEILANIQDPLFTIINKISYDFGLDFYYFCILCAGLTVFFKSLAFRVATKNFYALLFLYVSYLFILHDYIQIRVALALAIFLFSFYVVDNRLKWFLMIFSIFIHFSLILPLLCFIIYKMTFKNKFYYFSSILFIILCVSLLSYLSLAGFIQDSRSNYYLTTDNFSISFFTPRPFLQFISLILIYLFCKDKLFSFEFYISAIGVLIFYGMVLASPVLSSRFFDITSVFFIILLSSVYKRNIYLFVMFFVTILSGVYHLFLSPSAYLGYLGSFILN